MDGGASEPAGKKRKLNEPYVRDSAYIFRKYKGKPPSLIVHLHQTHFRFDGQDGSFAYDSPMKFVIEHLRKHTVPHEMMEDLLVNNVPFYDGCMIVEVHNHRAKEGRERGRNDSGVGDDKVKFGMHNYNEHITPSPFVPYPSKARTDGTPEKVESAIGDMPAPERPKEKDGPKITTIVLHPTSLAQHHELLILASTPASDVRSKKRGSDGATPSSAQPPTPQLSVPPTPLTQTSRGPLSQSQKMCLEEGDFYSFQSDMLVSTEPPLYLEPVDNPQDAQRVIDMLQHPLHQDKPPSPKTRKRTTAEMAADDAQAAETERRMLIMDERIKPTGAGTAANENQGAAASLGFSRFKTIEMVRQKHEEAERIKKDEEARVALEKKQAEEQHAQGQQQKMLMAQRQREMLMAQQQQPTQQQAMLMQQRRAAQAQAMAAAQAQQAQMTSQAHGHPQPNGMPPNQAQGFPQQVQTSMPQSSPVVRQQTPMKSSPMMPQDGFPMAQTSSQGAGSPPRPTSAVSQHPNVAMARRMSQQQGSRNNTPQMQQGTPRMGQAMPNRQMTQTPRMPPGSPAPPGMHQGTPTSGTMPMQTPHMNGQTSQLTPEQMAMLAAQRNQQNMGMQNGSPVNMTPDQIQNIQNLHRLRQHQNQQIQQAANEKARQAAALAQQQGQDPQQAYNVQMQRQRQLMIQHQQAMMNQRQQQHVQMQGSPGQAGSPGGMPHQTPQMGHAHPQQHPGQQGTMPDPSQLNPAQQQQLNAQAQAKAQQVAQMRQQQQHQLQQVVQPVLTAYGGRPEQVPQHIIAGLNPQAQAWFKQQAFRQQQARQQQLRAQQQAAAATGEQVPAQPANPQYMAQLRNNQAMLAQAQQQMANQHQGGGNLNMGGMTFNMPNMGQNGGGNHDLSPHFASMQNALNRNPSGQGGQGMQ